MAHLYCLTKDIYIFNSSIFWLASVVTVPGLTRELVNSAQLGESIESGQ